MAEIASAEISIPDSLLSSCKDVNFFKFNKYIFQQKLHHPSSWTDVWYFFPICNILNPYRLRDYYTLWRFFMKKRHFDLKKSHQRTSTKYFQYVSRYFFLRILSQKMNNVLFMKPQKCILWIILPCIRVAPITSQWLWNDEIWFQYMKERKKEDF